MSSLSVYSFRWKLSLAGLACECDFVISVARLDCSNEVRNTHGRRYLHAMFFSLSDTGRAARQRWMSRSGLLLGFKHLKFRRALLERLTRTFFSAYHDVLHARWSHVQTRGKTWLKRYSVPSIGPRYRAKLFWMGIFGSRVSSLWVRLMYWLFCRAFQ